MHFSSILHTLYNDNSVINEVTKWRNTNALPLCMRSNHSWLSWKQNLKKEQKRGTDGNNPWAVIFRTFFRGLYSLCMTLFDLSKTRFEILRVLAITRPQKIQNRSKFERATSQNVKVVKIYFGSILYYKIGTFAISSVNSLYKYCSDKVNFTTFIGNMGIIWKLGT